MQKWEWGRVGEGAGEAGTCARRGGWGNSAAKVSAFCRRWRTRQHSNARTRACAKNLRKSFYIGCPVEDQLLDKKNQQTSVQILRKTWAESEKKVYKNYRQAESQTQKTHEMSELSECLKWLMKERKKSVPAPARAAGVFVNDGTLVKERTKIQWNEHAIGCQHDWSTYNPSLRSSAKKAPDFGRNSACAAGVATSPKKGKPEKVHTLVLVKEKAFEWVNLVWEIHNCQNRQESKNAWCLWGINWYFYKYLREGEKWQVRALWDSEADS